MAGERGSAHRPPSRPVRLDAITDAAIRSARALRTPQGRRRQGQFLLEGVRLVEDALSQGLVPQAVFLTPHLLDSTERGRSLARQVRRLDVPLFEINERHLTLIADTETPPGILVVGALPAEQPYLPEPWAPGLSVLVLDQVRDPGNIGGILRTAAAAGVRHVVSTEGSADLWAPKVVRAGAGAHFRLTLYPGRPLAEVGEWLVRWPRRVVADGRAPTSIYSLDWLEPGALVLSNEARGASSWLGEMNAVYASIPMDAGTESLNVAAAAAVIIYEARRPTLRERA